MSAPTTTCDICKGSGFSGRAVNGHLYLCEQCEGSGFTGINPADPCPMGPGSSFKIATIQARYEAGLPLWNDADNQEHMAPADHISFEYEEFEGAE